MKKKLNVSVVLILAMVCMTGPAFAVSAIDVRIGSIAAQSTPVGPGSCAGVEPSFGMPGETLDVTIRGTDTLWQTQGVDAVAFSCADTATVTATEVISDTEIVVTVEIASAAPAPTGVDATDAGVVCDVLVTSGGEEVVCEQAFEITDEPPPTEGCSIAPAEIAEDTTATLTITVDESMVLDETAEVFLSAGCLALSLNGPAAVDVERQTVTVSVTAGTVSADTVCGLTIVQGDRTVACSLSIANVAACELSIAPRSVRSARIPMVRVLRIRGEGITARDDVRFSSEDIVPLIVLPGLPNRINVLILVTAGAQSGTCDVAVGACAGTFEIR
jgi:hypothetical protein